MLIVFKLRLKRKFEFVDYQYTINVENVRQFFEIIQKSIGKFLILTLEITK